MGGDVFGSFLSVEDEPGDLPRLDEPFLKVLELLFVRQRVMEKQVGRFFEGRVLRQFLDPVSPVDEDAVLAVHVG